MPGRTAVAAYIRVSSRAQDHSSQRTAIERVAAARGDRVSIWYAEKKSAKNIDRSELVRLREDARAGKITRLYLFRLDRLARSAIRDTFDVVEELRAHGVKIVTVADGFDLDGPAADVVLAVLAWAAKMERLAINERISAARECLAAEGRPWGRPPRLSPREVAAIIADHRAGRTVREIAQARKVPRSTVGRVLSQKDAAAAGA